MQMRRTANANMNMNAYEKLYGIEKNQIRKKSIWQGILIGFLASWLFLGGLVFVAWLNQDNITEAALEYLVNNYMRELFESFPDAYVSNNQHKIMPILDNFANSAAAKRVTPAEFKVIGKTVIGSLKDKKLTYEEITNILNLMDKSCERGFNL